MPLTTPRAVAVCRACGLLAGLLAAVLVVVLGPFGMGLIVSPALVGLGLLVGAIVGESAVRRPRWPTPARWRSTILPALPRNLAIAVLGGLVLLVAALVIAAITADDDALGRGGRALRRVCTSGQSAIASPWPGSHYGALLAMALGGGVLAAIVGLVLIARHPAGGSERDDPQRLHSRGARAILEGTAALVGACLGSVALTMGTVLANIGCAPTGLRITGWALLGLAVIAMLSALRYVARLLLGPAGRQARHHR